MKGLTQEEEFIIDQLCADLGFGKRKESKAKRSRDEAAKILRRMESEQIEVSALSDDYVHHGINISCNIGEANFLAEDRCRGNERIVEHRKFLATRCYKKNND